MDDARKLEERPILIGYDGGRTADDAVALGAQLTLPSDRLMLAFAYDAGSSTSEAAERLLRRGLGRLAYGRAAAIMAIPHPHPATMLAELARSVRARLIVVGSSAAAPDGAVVPAAVAQQLLASAPCPIAVAPAGLREIPADQLAHTLDDLILPAGKPAACA